MKKLTKIRPHATRAQKTACLLCVGILVSPAQCVAPPHSIVYTICILTIIISFYKPFFLGTFIFCGIFCAAAQQQSFTNHHQDFYQQDTTQEQVRFFQPPLFKSYDGYNQIVQSSYGLLLLQGLSSPLLPGQTLTGEIHRETYPSPRHHAPWEFDEYTFLSRRNITGTARIIPDTRENSFVTEMYGAIKSSITTFHPSLSPYYQAVLLRERHLLPSWIKDTFSAYGLMHITAVSGLHVGILLFSLWLILSILPLPGHVIRAAAVCIAWILLPLCGMTASTLRALIMATVFFSAPLFQRKPNALNSLAVAIIIILIQDPSQLFQAGFHLTITATLTILLAAPILQDFSPPSVRSLVLFCILPPLISLSTWPVLAFHFQEIAPAALWGNILFLPLIILNIQIIIYSLFLQIISAPLAQLLSTAALTVDIKLFSAMADLARSLNITPLPAALSTGGLIIALSYIFMTFYFVRRRMFLTYLYCTLCALSLWKLHSRQIPHKDALVYYETHNTLLFSDNVRGLLIISGDVTHLLTRTRFSNWLAAQKRLRTLFLDTPSRDYRHTREYLRKHTGIQHIYTHTPDSGFTAMKQYSLPDNTLIKTADYDIFMTCSNTPHFTHDYRGQKQLITLRKRTCN
ncbi:MAG: ComEC/Rec2 family competence protein [Fibrobacterota bacterium]